MWGGVWGCFQVLYPCISYLPRKVHGPPMLSEWLGVVGVDVDWVGGGVLVGEGGREGEAGRHEL